jgi:RND family efflux transporter MFP subunit
MNIKQFLSVCLPLNLALSPFAQAEPPAPKAALTVTVTKPTKATWNTSVLAMGTLNAWQEAVIAAEVSGQRIAQVLVDVGDTVKQGQELALLAQESVQADLAQAQARVAQAEASLAEARANASRARNLRADGALAAQQVDQYLTGEATAKANLAVQQAALQIQQIRLKQTRIVAVDDGVIISRSAMLGAVVQAGTELFRLVRQNRIEWQAEVAGRDLAQIQPGQRAQLTLPSGESVSGEVRRVAPTLDSNTRNATVYVSLPPDSSAKAGMFAQGEIFIGKTRALSLPQAAVIVRDGNYYVFEINKENRVLQRLVKTGRQMAGQVEIFDGIGETAKVAASGGAFLNDGDTVRVVDVPALAQPKNTPHIKSRKGSPNP